MYLLRSHVINADQKIYQEANKQTWKTVILEPVGHALCMWLACKSYLHSISSAMRCIGSGNLVIHVQQLSHCCVKAT